MTARAPVSLPDDEIAAVRSWVLHEDPHVLVLNKPAGLSSQGGRVRAHTLDDLLWAFARSNGKRPELVHRLDRDTSGVILAARTKPAAGFLGTWLSFNSNFDNIGHYARGSNRLSPVPPGTPLTTSQVVATQPAGAMTYAMPRPPGMNAGKPWFLPECGVTEDALDPAKDPETRR